MTIMHDSIQNMASDNIVFPMKIASVGKPGVHSDFDPKAK